MFKLMKLPPPPLAKLATLFLLIILAMPVQAQQCNESHIVLSRSTSDTVAEGSHSLFVFMVENCDKTSRQYEIPFCVEFFDTTQCSSNDQTCMVNKVAGDSGVRQFPSPGWKKANGFKRCNSFAPNVNIMSVYVRAKNNDFKDEMQNLIHVIMRNPTRYTGVIITDND